MGSLQQTVVGVICITAAFFFGQYMRTHPSPDTLALQAENPAVDTNATLPSFGSPFDTTSTANVGPAGLPAPSAGFGNAAAKPAEALLQTSPKTFQEMVTRVPKNQPAPTPIARQIDIPDFSELAASFENTPLALSRPSTVPTRTMNRPSQTTDRSSGDQTGMAPVKTPNLRRGSFVSSQRQRRVRQPPSAPPTTAKPDGSREGAYPALTGSPAERVAPPQPMESYELKQHASTFRQQDFAPQLRRQRNAQTTRPVTTDIRPQRLSLAPPERDNTMLTPEVPDLDVVLPQPAAHGATDSDKHVHSYYDTLSGNNGFTRGDFQPTNPTERTSRAAGHSDRFQSVTMEQRQPKTENVSVAKPPTEINSVQPRRSIPFALNEAGRSELARIRSRQQSNIDLPTDRFSRHTTQTGDTLQSLSIEYYGKPDFYLDIYLANQAVLRNPVQIPAGVQLQIPVYE